jgi:hypothetical protein
VRNWFKIFCFHKCNLYRYTAGHELEVGLCTLRIKLTHTP